MIPVFTDHLLIIWHLSLWSFFPFIHVCLCMSAYMNAFCLFIYTVYIACNHLFSLDSMWGTFSHIIRLSK